MTLKAFVVEDNESIRESLCAALLELADVVTCGVAASQEAAVGWLADPGNQWDIAIVDLMLAPGGSGFGVLEACRNRRPDQKVVVLTGTAHPDVRRYCEALGSDGVFDKAMETEALMDYRVALSAGRAP